MPSTQVERIRKRDGSVAVYDAGKLERSIQKAARAAGQDPSTLAPDLAEVVTTFLSNHFGRRTPTSRDIRRLVQKVLLESGYPAVAESYTRFRKSGKGRHDLTTGDLFPQDLIVITGGTRDESNRWSRGRIVEALVREADLDAETAGAIAARVEEKILALKMRRVSTTLVREFVNHELLQAGHPVSLERQRILGIPKADLRQMLSGGDPPDPDRLCMRLGEITLRQFALQEIYSPDVADAHLQGRIHIHNVEHPLKCFWGILPAEDGLPPAQGVSDPRIPRLTGYFSEALEFLDCRLENLPERLSRLTRAGPDRDRPRLVLNLRLSERDDLRPILDTIDAHPSLPIRLNLSGPGSRDRSLISRAVQRGGILFDLASSGGSRLGDEPLIIGQAVSLNLPQCWARRSGADGLFAEIEEALELAVRANVQRHQALGGTLPRDRLPKIRFAVAVQGLSELVRLATGSRPGEDECSGRWALQVMGFLAGLVREAALRHGLSMDLTDVLSRPAVERFARIDAKLFPAIGSEQPYTPGAHVASDLPLAGRLAAEARLGTLIRGWVFLLPRESRTRIAADEVAQLLRTAQSDGRIRRILLP